MANSDTAFGFKPVKHLNGNPWNGKINVYYIPATDAVATFRGDAVKSAGSATADGLYPTVTQAAATDAVRGVVIGFSDQPYVAINQDDLLESYRPASVARYAFVVDDPDVIFEVQEDSVGNSITADMVGLSTDIAVGTGSTVTGLSAMELDSSDTATGAGQCKILRVVNRLDNALGDHCKWEVLLIEHEMRAATDV
jgi:hypothetical protein